MTDSHGQTNINLAPQQGLTQLVFAPNGSTQDGDGLVFNEFDAVIESITNFPGLYEIYMDPGPIPPVGAAPQITIPAGTYDFNNQAYLVGARQSTNIINVDGAVFDNLLGARNCDFINSGSAILFQSTVPGESYLLDFDQCSFTNNVGATSPMFRAGGSGGVFSITFRDCTVSNNAGVNVLDANDALSGFVIAQRSSRIGTQAISAIGGLGVANISIDSNSVLWPDVQAIDATGTLSVTRSETFYVSAADAADWAVSVPDNYQDAITRIASVVAGAHGAIP